MQRRGTDDPVRGRDAIALVLTDPDLLLQIAKHLPPRSLVQLGSSCSSVHISLEALIALVGLQSACPRRCLADSNEPAAPVPEPATHGAPGDAEAPHVQLLAQAVARPRQARKLRVSDSSQPAECTLRHLAVLFPALGGIRALQLAGLGLTACEVALLADEASVLSSLTELSLTGNFMGAAGAAALAPALPRLPRLEALELGYNQLLLPGLVALTPGVRALHNLQHLGLAANGLSDTAAPMIEALVNPHIDKVKLRPGLAGMYFNILRALPEAGPTPAGPPHPCPPGAPQSARARAPDGRLSRAPLLSLDLSGNPLVSADHMWPEPLLAALAHLSHLTRLHLAHCGATVTWLPLYRVLARHTALRDLDIRCRSAHSTTWHRRPPPGAEQNAPFPTLVALVATLTQLTALALADWPVGEPADAVGHRVDSGAPFQPRPAAQLKLLEVLRGLRGLRRLEWPMFIGGGTAADWISTMSCLRHISELRCEQANMASAGARQEVEELLVRVLPACEHLRRLALCVPYHSRLEAALEGCTALEALKVTRVGAVGDWAGADTVLQHLTALTELRVLGGSDTLKRGARKLLAAVLGAEALRAVELEVFVPPDRLHGRRVMQVPLRCGALRALKLRVAGGSSALDTMIGLQLPAGLEELTLWLGKLCFQEVGSSRGGPQAAMRPIAVLKGTLRNLRRLRRLHITSVDDATMAEVMGESLLSLHLPSLTQLAFWPSNGLCSPSGCLRETEGPSIVGATERSAQAARQSATTQPERPVGVQDTARSIAHSWWYSWLGRAAAAPAEPIGSCGSKPPTPPPPHAHPTAPARGPHSTYSDGAGCSKPPQLPALKPPEARLMHLSLQHPSVSYLCTERFGCERLTRLDLCGVCPGPDGVAGFSAWLAGLSTLRRLHLRHAHVAADGLRPLARALARLTRLAVLDVVGVSLAEDGRLLLAGALRGLRELQVVVVGAEDLPGMATLLPRLHVRHGWGMAVEAVW